MAGCIITSGITTPGCTDRFASPGISRADIYVFNHSEISAYTSTVTGEVSALTFSPSYEVGFLVSMHKNSASFSEELVADENSAPYYNLTFAGKIIANDTDTRVAIEDMVDVDLVIVAKAKSGVYYILGESGGLKLTENTFTTGATNGDEIGDTLSFTGVENGRARVFLDTNEATTKITLDSYL